MSRAALVFSAVVLASAAAPSLAHAQTVGGATVTASGLPNPARLLPNGNNACGGPASDTSCVSTRPQNLTPLGISYQDCVDNQTLRFSVLLSGFTGAQNVQVWASTSSDCTQATDRGTLGAAAAVCWKVSGDLVGAIVSTPATYTFDVRVQDLVGWQQHPPFPVPAGVQQLGPEACNAQLNFTAVPMNVNFVPVDNAGNYAGQAYQYQINTDMVGPPAPAQSGMSDTAGDSLINLNWTANADVDTAGYDIFIDPPPGGTASDAAYEAGLKLVCPDAGNALPTGIDATPGTGDDGSSADASGNDGSLDATSTLDAVATSPDAASVDDAGCYYINVGGSPPASANGYNCNDSILASGVTQDSGVTTTTATYDEAGNLLSEGGVVEGSGGIATIPMQYAVGISNGLTVSDKAVGSYTITGLTNKVTYTVVVAAVDGYGNIGPPSAEVCDYPAPVNDFWQQYEKAGGGGGFCALESVGAGGSSLVGAGGVLLAAGLLRRRRARRR